MAKHSKNPLSAEDRELWQRVTRTANPMHPAKPVLPKTSKPARPASPKQEPIPKFQVAPFRIGETALVSPARREESKPISPIDRKQLARMKRGKLKPQARIDLHGMTQDQALPVLNRFILDAADRGLRLVLVITGKGRPRPDFGPIPEQPGVLRRNVPFWLRSGVLAPLVMDVIEAHQSHGGGGAFYVYLRARR